MTYTLADFKLRLRDIDCPSWACIDFKELKILPTKGHSQRAVDERNGITVHNDQWVVYPIAVSENGSHIHIVCPLCGMIHKHKNEIGTVKAACFTHHRMLYEQQCCSEDEVAEIEEVTDYFIMEKINIEKYKDKVTIKKVPLKKKKHGKKIQQPVVMEANSRFFKVKTTGNH